MSDAAACETPLRTTFKIELDSKTVSIATVGQAYQFLTGLGSVEWLEFRSLHDDAVNLLTRAAGDAMLTVPATTAVRALFVAAKLL